MTGKFLDHFEVAARVIQALERLGSTYVIGGSLAAAFAGEPRSTVDVDLVAVLEPQHVKPLVDALVPEFYVDERQRRIRLGRWRAGLHPETDFLGPAGRRSGVLNSIERFSASADHVEAALPMLNARAGHTATLLPGLTVLFAGGTDAAGDPLGEPRWGCLTRKSPATISAASHSASR